MPANPAHQPQQQRDLGAFYTPAWAAQHMIDLVDQLPTVGSILEPSGGDGAFVHPLLDHVTPDKITVWDIDPTVAEPLESLGVTVEIGDALLRDDTDTFDLIIGNPPYLNKASTYLRTHKGVLGKRYQAIGVNDTYALFTYMATRRLNPGGQLLFLISDTFLTLGIHRKLRQHLLATTRIDSVTLLPADTFTDASVHTAIIKVTNAPAPAGHLVTFVDARNEPAPTLTGPTYRVPQRQLAANPGRVFAFTGSDTAALKLVTRLPRLMDHLDGGLGMHTGDNHRYLLPLTGPRAVDLRTLDRARWRPYHKRGGATRWWAPLDHVVDGHPDSVSQYGIPATATAGTGPDGIARAGLVLSGISSRLAARTMVPGALWESNKVFGLFPKDPDTYPVEFFLAILNSDTYTRIANALNHTVSLQVRDLNQFPMLPFTPGEVRDLAELAGLAVSHVRDGGQSAGRFEDRINTIVNRAAAR